MRRRHYATMSIDRIDAKITKTPRRLYRTGRLVLKVARYSQGRYSRECTVCGYEGQFNIFGLPPRIDAQCHQCFSLERHRHLALLLREHELVHAGDQLLHFAPEPAMTRVLRERSDRYKSADIVPGVADLTLDATAIDLPSSSQDVIVASHVLEHVDDIAALAEFRRVLRPGGRLIAMIPTVDTWVETFEDPSITNAGARERVFGQSDHVRIYGQDCRQRFTNAGFDLREHIASPADCLRYGIENGSVIFVGTKTPTNGPSHD